MYISKFNFGIPNHVAIIMDGNGRWASRKNLKRSVGHRVGVEVVEKVLECCFRIGVKNLTLYAFSTENWKRPVVEVNSLMKIISNFFKKKTFHFRKKNKFRNTWRS